MEGGRVGGCCITRLCGDANVASKVGRIMLRFRPIAPKPPAPGSGGTAKLEEGSGDGGCVSSGKGRKRRRGSSSSGGGGGGGCGKDGSGIRRGRKKREAAAAGSVPVPAATGSTSSSSSEEVGSLERVVAKLPEPITLPLLPETPERKDEGRRVEMEQPSQLGSDLSIQYAPPPWCEGQMWKKQPSRMQVLAPTPVRPMGSSTVTVECVTEDGTLQAVAEHWKWLWWCKEAEARSRLEGDSWPAFVSDAGGRVTWTNAAYRRMVGVEEEGGGGGGGLRVALVTMGKVVGGCRSFTCRVRLKYASRKEKGSLTAPCDVWRLADGGLAWRLDIDAALSLRR